MSHSDSVSVLRSSGVVLSDDFSSTDSMSNPHIEVNGGSVQIYGPEMGYDTCLTDYNDDFDGFFWSKVARGMSEGQIIVKSQPDDPHDCPTFYVVKPNVCKAFNSEELATVLADLVPDGG